MILTQSKIQQMDALEPNKIEFGDILLSRQQNLSRKRKNAILRSQTGEQGELEVIRELKTYGNDHWLYLRNVWLDMNGRFECDLVVLTNVRPYIFEIKNYDGLLTYEDGDCTLRGYDLSENCIFQATRTYKKVRNLCQQTNIVSDVKGAIVFVGKYNPIEIKSPVRSIDVIEKSRLKNYIELMVEEEKHYQTRQFDGNRLMRQFDKYGISDPFKYPPLNEEDIKDIKTGIHCGLCGSDNLKMSRNYVKCNCGFQEPREEAIVRTICEYGVLRYDKDFRAYELMSFLDNEPSSGYLYKLLDKHFEKVKIGRRIFYINKKLPYKKIHEQFSIALPKLLPMNNNTFLLQVNNGFISNFTRL